MKKFLKTMVFLFALSSIAYAEDDAMAVLNKKRVKIEKADKEKLEKEKLAEKKVVVKKKKVVKAAPKTEKEKLEATRKEALEKLDFYERVVRSVAREEAEVAEYYEIMNGDIKTTEAIEQDIPVEENAQ